MVATSRRYTADLIIRVFRLLSKLPNSYAFTKALGEALVVEAMKEIPVIILRPSIGKFRNISN